MGPNDFVIERFHPDFAATGLTQKSRIDVQKLALPANKFRKQLGRIEGGLREDFEVWLESGVLWEPPIE